MRAHFSKTSLAVAGRSAARRGSSVIQRGGRWTPSGLTSASRMSARPPPPRRRRPARRRPPPASGRRRAVTPLVLLAAAARAGIVAADLGLLAHDGVQVLARAA